jgi:hypothetical protein
MSKIKNDPMSLRNGPVVNGFGAHNSEQIVGLRARLYQAGVKVVPYADSSGGGSHGISL